MKDFFLKHSLLIIFLTVCFLAMATWAGVDFSTFSMVYSKGMLKLVSLIKDVFITLGCIGIIAVIWLVVEWSSNH